MDVYFTFLYIFQKYIFVFFFLLKNFCFFQYMPTMAIV